MLMIALYLLAIIGILAIGFFIGSWCVMQNKEEDLTVQISTGVISHKHKLYEIKEIK